MLRRALVSTVIVTLAVAACSKKPAPQQPAPPPPPQPQANPVNRDSLEAARRAEEEARRRAAAAARAREVLQEMVFFDYDKSNIRPDAQEVLTRKVNVLRANPAVSLRITGHADERGSVEYNLALGQRRADAVRDYLTGFGLDASRFTTTSMGEDQPLDPGHDEAAWARNRRDEFTITAGGDNLVMPGT